MGKSATLHRRLGGINEDQKNKPVPKKIFFLRNQIEFGIWNLNNCGTPKACFTLGLDFFGHIKTALNVALNGLIRGNNGQL